MEEVVKIKILSKKEEKIKSTIALIFGVVLLVGFFSAVVFWELQGRKLVQYTEIPVAGQYINRGDVIDTSMFSTMLIDREMIIDGAIKDISSLIGKSANQFIPAKSQLHELYFDEPYLITTEERMVTKIPKDWMHSVPSTIRRKDTAVFIALDSVQQNEINVSFNENGMPIGNNNLKDKEPVLEAVVAYVRDSQNKEVTTTSYEQRLNASSNVADIEVIITADEFKYLEQYIKQGYKFVIMYY